MQTKTWCKNSWCTSHPLHIFAQSSGKVVFEQVKSDNYDPKYIVTGSKTIDKVSFVAWNDNIGAKVIVIGQDNYYYDSNTKGLSTSGTCKFGEFTKSTTNCIVCKVGYQLSDGSCSSCSSTPSNCEEYNNCKCMKCKNGFYQENGNCVEKKTISNCASMIDHGICIYCSSGYHIKDNICVSNDENCLKYGNSRCLKCKVGYKILNGECVAGDDSNCYYEGTLCKACKLGYYFSNGNCVAKTNLINNNDPVSKDEIIKLYIV